MSTHTADHAMVESAVITPPGYHLRKECCVTFCFVMNVDRDHRSNLVVFTSPRIQMWKGKTKQGKDTGVSDGVI